LASLTVGNKLISLGAPLWEFPFLPIHKPLHFMYRSLSSVSTIVWQV
jgi:hypothetical protein